jgi:glycosyltransferase involved in cell wall biosynthesis
LSIPAINTKCGGPSPRRYYPKINDLILFSNENMDFFKKRKKFSKTHIYLIPNRVQIPEQNKIAIAELKKLLRFNAKVILRIARFGIGHWKSIADSIELTKRLRRDDIDVQLVIVGVIEDESIYKRLLSYANEDILIITENKYTINAASISTFADLIVGTGRSAMEAAVLGKPLLVPTESLSIPVLVTQSNIEEFSYYNFSPRTKIEYIDETSEYMRIKEVVKSKDAYKSIQSFIEQYAQHYFNISNVREKYIDIYKKTEKCRFNFDLLLHFYIIWKTFLSFRK